MKLTRLILNNVKCYEYLDLSFEHEDEDGKDQIRKRTIILGNNGTGKSTILRAIALSLAGSSALGEIVGEPDLWIKNGTDSCKIETHLQTEAGEARVIKLEFHRGDNLSKLITRNEESLSQLDAALDHTKRNYLNLAYGVHRRIGNSHFRSNSSSYKHPRANHIATLFDPEAALYPFESWLMDLDYRKGPRGMNTIKKALNKLLPESKFYGIDKEAKTAKFKTKDGIVSFDQLSDGFQITANWLGDLLYRISNTYNDYDDPLSARFILLIDEIALHLHPGWQRKILQSISNLFVNAQIVATTHSPFVAQQAGDSELFTIIRNENKQLDLYHYENDPRKLLIHQIIMSDIFGISTDESVAVENAKDEIRKNKESGAKKGGGLTEESDKEDALPKALEGLKGITKISDIPINLYTHEQVGIGYADLLLKLNEEIKKLNDESSKS